MQKEYVDNNGIEKANSDLTTMQVVCTIVSNKTTFVSRRTTFAVWCIFLNSADFYVEISAGLISEQAVACHIR